MSIRVLVVDDEALIALDVAQQLTDAGYEIIGPATTVAGALELLKKHGCDAAVLDARLGDETSEVIAQQLQLIGKPFVVLSGYSSEHLTSTFGNAPLLSKPPRGKSLLAALKECLKSSRSMPA